MQNALKDFLLLGLNVRMLQVFLLFDISKQEKSKYWNERSLLLGLACAAEGIELHVPGTLLNTLRLLCYCSCLLLCHRVQDEAVNGERCSVQSGGRKCFRVAVTRYSSAECSFYSSRYV